MIIIDENIDQFFIDKLKNKNYEIFLVREYKRGISDREIIEFARVKEGLIITEDKDFGELVFSFNLKFCSVVFLRYEKEELENIGKKLIGVIKRFYKKSGHYFITISKQKIRIRKI